MPFEYPWQKGLNDDEIAHDKEQIDYWKKRKAILKRRFEGFEDPEHPLKPQNKRPVGDDEKKAIREAIETCDLFIMVYEEDWLGESRSHADVGA